MKKKWMLEDISNKKRNKLPIILVICFIFIMFLFYIILSYHQRCNSWECFNENLAKCKKTIFAGGTDIIFGYVINGRNSEICEVSVTLLEGQLNNQDTKTLKGKEMICSMEYGVVMLPESDLSNCRGELKEKLQEQVINDLYSYIIQNLGQLNKNIINPLGYINE